MPLEIVDDQSESAFARGQTGLLFNLPAPPAEYEQLPPGISLCMIVKNEERFLAECLRSVHGAVDEINIVDTGSTDATVEIARSFGASVTFREWRHDFGWARNESLALATRRWTLVLDADEEIAPEAVALLRALRETPAHLTGVYVQIQNTVDDVSGRGSTMTHVLPRLFPTSPRIRYRNVIHESVVVDNGTHLESVVSPIVVKHKGYAAEVVDARAKNERNKPLLERALREAGDDAYSWFNFGIAAIVAGDHETGIETLERMFAMPGPHRAFFPIAYVMLAQAHADGRRDYDRAVQVLDEGLQSFPAHPNIVFTRAYVLSLMCRYDDSRAEYERAMNGRFEAAKHSMVDDEIFTWKCPLNIATTYIKEGRIADALPWFERALANKPESPLLRAMLAAAYERAERFYDAERRFGEAAELDGEAGFAAHVNYLMRRRRFQEAFERVERRREYVNDAAYVALLLSAAQAMRDEHLGDPEPFARRALEIAPAHGGVLRFLDEWYASRGESAKRDALRTSELAAQPATAADFARRSHRLLQDGRPDDAFAFAMRGLALEPGDAILSYNAGLAAARLHRDEEALKHLDAVPADDGHATAALALRAEIERRSGDLDAAVQTLHRAHALPAPDAATLRHAAVGLATALLQAGRLADAGTLANLALT